MFIDSRYKQSKNHNLNARFTLGKEYKNCKLKYNIFSVWISSGTLRHQSLKMIAICVFFSLTLFASGEKECKNKLTDFPSCCGLIQVQNTDTCN